MKTLHIYSKLLVVSLLILSACTTSKKEKIPTDNSVEKISYTAISKAQFKNSNMELGTIAMQNFSEGIVTNGFIDVPPASKAKVSAIMAGFVKNSPLLIGDKVKKGQLLLTIENTDFIEIQQNYLEIFEKLKYLKNEYERQKILFDEQITSQKNYLKAESDYKSAAAQVNSLEQKLRLMNINISNVKAGKFTSIIPIYAPISGSVTQVNASMGKFMNASDVILEVINSDHKHLELVVFEKDILKVKQGQLIKFQIPENSEKICIADVHLIGTSIDEINRTVRVHGHLKDESEPFLVGMFVEAEIITDSKEKMALPISALLEEDGNFFVLVLNATTEEAYNFEKISIQTGLKNENWIEIIDTMNSLESKKILVNGAFVPLEDG